MMSIVLKWASVFWTVPRPTSSVWPSLLIITRIGVVLRSGAGWLPLNIEEFGPMMISDAVGHHRRRGRAAGHLDDDPVRIVHGVQDADQRPGRGVAVDAEDVDDVHAR